MVKNRPKTKFERRAITHGSDIFDIVAFKKMIILASIGDKEVELNYLKIDNLNLSV